MKGKRKFYPTFRLVLAMGSGLGHLSRISGWVSSLEPCSNLVLIPWKNKALFHNFFPKGDISIPLPEKNLDNPDETLDTLKGVLKDFQFQPEEGLLDTFPAGIRGEYRRILEFFPIKWTLVTRRLKWEAYRPLVEGWSPSFEQAFALEPLHPGQEEWIQKQSSHFSKSTPPLKKLTSKKEEPVRVWQDRVLKGEKPLLVVHSGSAKEIDFLVQKALEFSGREKIIPPIFLFGREGEKRDGVSGPHFRWNLTPYFHEAGGIFTGCGFNLMNELAPFRKKHHFFPFFRKFDDQHFRSDWFLKNED